MFAHGETVTRLRAPEVSDRYSGTDATSRDWSAATSQDIAGWLVADNSSSEPLEVGRNAVVSDFSLFREEPADVLPTDRLVIRGLICEVKGRAFAWQYMSGSAAGQAVKANIVEG